MLFWARLSLPQRDLALSLVNLVAPQEAKHACKVQEGKLEQSVYLVDCLQAHLMLSASSLRLSFIPMLHTELVFLNRSYMKD